MNYIDYESSVVCLSVSIIILNGFPKFIDLQDLVYLSEYFKHIQLSFLG